MKNFIICLLALAFLCLCLNPLQASAASTAPDLSQPCSLTLHYDTEDAGFPDLDISIYRFAEIQADLSMDLVTPYSSLPVSIHGITSQQAWNTVASTLSAYIAADSIPATRTEKTDSDGTVRFTDLQSGLYLVSPVTAENEEGIYTFDTFVILVPGVRDEAYHYDVEANPKCSKFTPAEEYTVIKLWKDAGNTNRRPASIRVDILRDSTLVESVLLSSENNWSYTWKVQPGDTGIWTVAEKDVPKDYQVTISQKAFTFTITNTNASTPPPPQTGDSFPVVGIVMIMCLSGCAIILLEIYRRRRR